MKKQINRKVTNRNKGLLRTVPTFVTAHTFCASGDTLVFYGWCIFLRGLKLSGESRT